MVYKMNASTQNIFHMKLMKDCEAGILFLILYSSIYFFRSYHDKKIKIVGLICVFKFIIF